MALEEEQTSQIPGSRILILSESFTWHAVSTYSIPILLHIKINKQALFILELHILLECSSMLQNIPPKAALVVSESHSQQMQATRRSYATYLPPPPHHISGTGFGKVPANASTLHNLPSAQLRPPSSTSAHAAHPF